ncbi:hypothetical protein WH47_12072 [Habropoda laboriosa]|uniref:Uncharacterized protein n=1 Tax=Habropoda laboriosa TaxID=597456 RepID=A0A0L7R187_9HYME|nr:hypothetical protein WH47_12072 [Habropoda laboriosa]
MFGNCTRFPPGLTASVLLPLQLNLDSPFGRPALWYSFGLLRMREMILYNL